MAGKADTALQRLFRQYAFYCRHYQVQRPADGHAFKGMVVLHQFIKGGFKCELRDEVPLGGKAELGIYASDAAFFVGLIEIQAVVIIAAQHSLER